mmetsp:Transcript_98300/g.278369  ORF Transcript_98300/g.278369 Transcript_98300/m.278369 type:complete len:458 (+) Transcript_98300:51-1424(+)
MPSRGRVPPHLKRIGEDYLLGLRLSGGSFGEVYFAVNTKTGEELAAKVEKRRRQSMLLKEAEIMRELQGGIGFAALRFCTVEAGRTILLMELLGQSLEDLFRMCGRKFDLQTILMVADQVLYRIEFLHSRDYIHGDIKPGNFLIGSGDRANRIFMVDFGLSRRFRDAETRQHIPYRDDRSLSGTARFASINTHRGVEQSRRDDITAIGYMLLYFLKGKLPWQDLSRDPVKEQQKRKEAREARQAARRRAKRRSKHKSRSPRDSDKTGREDSGRDSEQNARPKASAGGKEHAKEVSSKSSTEAREHSKELKDGQESDSWSDEASQDDVSVDFSEEEPEPANARELIKEKHRKIMECKMAISIEELCLGQPPVFEQYLHYCRNLQFEAQPNYAYLRRILKDTFIHQMNQENAFATRSFIWMRPVSPEEEEAKDEAKGPEGGRGLLGCFGRCARAAAAQD